MTRADRAKQFLPFSALSGLEKALAKQEFVPEERRSLGEDAQAELDTTLRSLGIGNTVTVTYYHAATYQTLTGPVDRVDPIEAPEIFRVLGKRRPEFVRPFVEQLQQISEIDKNRVVKIHSLGAIKAVISK